MSIYQFAQWINWHEVAEEGKPKPRKVPFNPQNGRASDPHNKLNWKTYDEAKATGHPVGFVFAATDPFFFLDLDDCWIDGAWTPEAVAIFNTFPGAAREISTSGHGLHVVGRCDQLVLSDRKNKFGTAARPNWLEFYTTERFMALGRGFEGNFDLDWTPQLLNLVPQRPAVDPTTMISGPVPEYTGPQDDAELIRKMVAARGSIGAQFGTKASAKDLWEGDPANLSQVFPSPSNDVYDRSSADAALMAHLAFWTGKDSARMDRLFRRSALMRPKYEQRAAYRESTITNAVSQCRRVYDVVKDNNRAQPTITAPGTTGEATTGTGYLMVGEMLDHFKGCVYVRDAHRVMVPGGALLRPEQFKSTYGGHKFQMTSDLTEPEKNAFVAFTENRAFTFPKAERLAFRPLEEPGSIVNGAVNSYYPDPQPDEPGDVKPFLDFMEKLLPNADDRATLLAWCASAVQNIGHKFQWAPVVQGVEGNGKTLVARCLGYAIGPKYTHQPSAEDLGNPFNSYIENKLLISVEEVHLQGRRELLDTLKPLITNDRVEIQPKGVDKRMIDNFANWFFCTNHRDAVLKTKDDRRYAIFFTAQQTYDDIVRDGMAGDYFPNLYTWLRTVGYKRVAHFLKTYPIPVELDPAGACHRAPTTSSTLAAITASMGRAEQELTEAIETDEQGFRQGWISMRAVEKLFAEKHIRISRQKTSDMLEAMGFKSLGRSTKPIMSEDNKRPTLYVRRSMNLPDGAGYDAYIVAQGYVNEVARPNVVPGAPGVVQMPSRVG